MKRIAAVMLCLLLASCAGIPFGTMLKMASYDWQDVVDADPAAVRAAVMVPQDVSVGAEGIVLSLTMNDADAGNTLFSADADLALQEQGRHVVTPLPTADDGRHWLVYGLDDDGTSAFRLFQRTLQQARQQDRDIDIAINIRAIFDRPDEMKRMPMSLWLKLAADDDWFVLVDEAEVEFGREYGTD